MLRALFLDCASFIKTTLKLGMFMDINSTNENSKGARGMVSVIGLVIIVIGMVASVQADGSFVPDIVMAVGTIIILVAEKVTLNESAHK